MTNSSDNVRLFAAIPLDFPTKANLASQTVQIKEIYSFRKWVHEQDYHITLKFLGDTEPGTADKVQESLARIAAATQPFTLMLNGLGTFGRAERPDILWAGVAGDLERLNELYSRVEPAMTALGYAAEGRPYRPHITVARKYSGADAFTAAALGASALGASAGLAGTAAALVSAAPASAGALGGTPAQASALGATSAASRPEAGDAADSAAEAALQQPSASWTADRIVLYVTRLGRSPMYEAYGVYPFAGSPQQ